MAELSREQLVEIREALYSGKQVWITDGQVRSAANASGGPLAGKALDFYNAKLADIEQRVQHGWNFSITPDGTISGMDGKGSSLRATPDPALDNKDVDFAHSAINGGQQVRIEPDGTMIATTPVYDPGFEPDAKQIEMSIKKFDEAVSSGDLATLHQQGAAVTFEPNASQTEEIPLSPPTAPSASATPPATSDLGHDPSDLDGGAAAAPPSDEHVGDGASADQPASDGGGPLGDLDGANAPSGAPPATDQGEQPTPPFDDTPTMNDPSIDSAPSTLDIGSSDDDASSDTDLLQNDTSDSS